MNGNAWMCFWIFKMGVVLMGASCMPSSHPAPGAADAMAEAHHRSAVDDDRVTCHYEKQLGSNLRRKVCRSRRQRAQDREQSQDAVRRRQGRPDARLP